MPNEKNQGLEAIANEENARRLTAALYFDSRFEPYMAQQDAIFNNFGKNKYEYVGRLVVQDHAQRKTGKENDADFISGASRYVLDSLIMEARDAFVEDAVKDGKLQVRDDVIDIANDTNQKYLSGSYKRKTTPILNVMEEARGALVFGNSRAKPIGPDFRQKLDEYIQFASVPSTVQEVIPTQ